MRVFSAPHKERYNAGLEQGLEQGLEKGVLSAKVETAQNMLKEGFEWSTIQKITGMNQTEFKKLQRKS
jgi:predicted transposase/invertase (TIGR01784 family)